MNESPKNRAKGSLLTALALGVLSVLSIASGASQGPVLYSHFLIASGVLGCVGAALGASVWLSAAWVRAGVKAARQAGDLAWPIRTQSSDAPRHRVGFLVGDPDGIRVHVREGVVVRAWNELNELTPPTGKRNRKGVLISGPKAGAVIVTFLTDDGVIALAPEEQVKCAEALAALQIKAARRA